MPAFWKGLAICAGVLVLPFVSTATNVTTFTNFGAGMSYDVSGGNVVGNIGDGSAYAQADQFQSASSGMLTSLQLALSCATVCPSPFSIALVQDSGGQPGAVLESFSYSGAALGTTGNNNAPVLLTSSVKPMLIAGDEYWVEVLGDSSALDAITWNWNNTNDQSATAISIDNGITWYAPAGETPGALAVTVNTPEPASAGLFVGAGLLLALFCLRNRLRAYAQATATALILGSLIVVAPIQSLAASWAPLTNVALGGGGVMILLTDGTIMVQNGSSANWMRLTPDATGSYINGTWSALARMNLDRLYFAAQVLRSGKVWVLGGEYSGPNLDANITPYAEIYDPVANSWSAAAPYPNENVKLRPTYCGTRTVTSNTTVTSGSAVLTGIYSTGRMQPGWVVTGTGIPANTTIVSVDSNTQVTISNTATSTGTPRLTYSGIALACFGDDPSIVMPDGNILAGNIFTNENYTYNVAGDFWTYTTSKFYSDRSDEEGWAKLADNKVLTYDLFQTIGQSNGNGYAELYNPATQTWSSISPIDGSANGTLPVLSSVALGYELGPTLRLQDGRMFQIGANQHTALYNESTNTWAAGPDIIGTLTNSQGTVNGNFGGDDAPAAILPNGHVILAADAGPAASTTTGNVTNGSRVITNIPSTAGYQVGWSVTGTSGSTTIISGTISSVDSATQITLSKAATGTATPATLAVGAEFSRPTQLFDFNPTNNSLAPVAPAIPDASLNTRASYVTRMLVLPTGQLLFSDSSSQLYVYTPDGSASLPLRPVVNGIAYNGGGVFTLTGKQLNGQSAGSAYGDDIQMDENYPIVRLSNSAGQVFYCRTTNWSLTGVGTGTELETVNFTLNPNLIAPGNYTVSVSGAGIVSLPAVLNITQAEINGQ